MKLYNIAFYDRYLSNHPGDQEGSNEHHNSDPGNRECRKERECVDQQFFIQHLHNQNMHPINSETGPGNCCTDFIWFCFSPAVIFEENKNSYRLEKIIDCKFTVVIVVRR